MPSIALPEAMLRSARAGVPMRLLDAFSMRIPSPVLGNVPLGIRVVPVGSTPTKLPTIVLPSDWTTMPSPLKLVMSRPRRVLPPLPVPRVKPLAFEPAPVPSS